MKISNQFLHIYELSFILRMNDFILRMDHFILRMNDTNER